MCFLIPMFLFAALVATVQADLGSGPERENYEAAMESDILYKIQCSREDISDFVGVHRPNDYVALLLHNPHNTGCRNALAEFEKAAADMADLPIAFAHAQCKTQKHLMGITFGIKNFPAFLFWRNVSFNSAELIGQQLLITLDEPFFERAVRNTGPTMKVGRSWLNPGPRDRMTMMGEMVTVVGVDAKDVSVQAVTSDNVTVRLPEEVLMTTDRKPLPYRRDESYTFYHAKWEHHEFEDFIKRFLSPLIMEIDGRDHLEKLMEKEVGPSLVLCAPAVSPVFVELASAHQNTSRSFHARTPEACPVPAPADDKPDSSRLVVYSSHKQQWAANGKPKAAAAVASGDIMKDEPALDDWVMRNHFPGIQKLCAKTFRDRIRGNRGNIVVGLRMTDKPKDLEDARFAQEKLHEIAKPQAISDDLDLYEFGVEYGVDGYFVAVADSTLPGLAHFGIERKKNLPKVVVFDNIDHWVEDRDLTLDKFPQALETIHESHRIHDTFSGTYVLWRNRWRHRINDLDEIATSKFGPMGRPFLVGSLASSIILVFFLIKRNCWDAAPHEKGE
mmetsp:Transcript_96259/g.170967  ORF Transcript_96259/g.170967 Transcript_96259/m.170967 type:complete len:559 (-) Transcript_96259:148-1824(-)|eukprot:CAMPEP_0197643744 /NCGR_PEP_ID=MMETSP1338-20131121/16951_1 /TAXON_ID=43686 ORGANISM="Pelagodinium beii, Strain RCC1491" /NCGR_SAMPLE_ID=MMETSP1338 /ASSEMBLY_ACC=CAM_ASM_000754 /LENGTH=558 /DNA_ID=CAMNT_0043217029 /DNA_START=37 /DNA_END=1713 /DNA_ORIENTATION=-